MRCPLVKKLKHLIPRRDSWVEIKGAKWSWPDAWTLQVSLYNIVVFMKTKDLLHDVIFTMSILYLGILGRHQIWMLCRNGVTGWLLSTCKEHKPRKGQGGSGQIKEKVSNLSGLTQYFTRHSLTPYHLHSKTRQRLGKHLSICPHLYLGIAQITITPPPRTQTGTLGHFFQAWFERLCQITILRVCKCHKESW